MAEKEGPSRTQKIKESVQFFLLLFCAGFGIYQFIYNDIYVPSRRPPAITLAATLEELDRADGMILVRAHMAVANHGDAKVWVPALWWHVYGVSFSGEDRTADQFAPTRWEMNKEGILTPTLLIKQSGWDKDHPERVMPFEPETNARQRKQGDREDAGHDSTTASLRLKPKAATAANQNTKH